MADESSGDSLLPYRVTGEDLVKLIESIARGRSIKQIQSFFSRKSFDGTLTAARLLGLIDEQDTLTPPGEEFALAGIDEKRRMLWPHLMGYEPYGLFLEHIVQDDVDAATELDQVEKWWNINGYGNSQSNRSEGSSAFAQFLDFAGLGTYIRGRRGKSTRIEWDHEALQELQGSYLGVSSTVPSEPPRSVRPEHLQRRDRGGSSERRRALDAIVGNTVSLDLGGGRVAEIIVPPRLRADEKSRLLALIDLLIETDASEGTALAGVEEERDTAETPPEETSGTPNP